VKKFRLPRKEKSPLGESYCCILQMKKGIRRKSEQLSHPIATNAGAKLRLVPLATKKEELVRGLFTFKAWLHQFPPEG
tara:strand:- start:48241 stop:48474 length:234 start_codon:yes stop_codon:yes gene_type:complete